MAGERQPARPAQPAAQPAPARAARPEARMSMRAREEDARAAAASAASSVEFGDAQDDRVTQGCSSSASAASSASSTEASTTANSSSEGAITSSSSSSPSSNAKNTITMASCPGEVEGWELTEECKDASILPEIWDKEYDHDFSAELLPGSAEEAQLERKKCATHSRLVHEDKSTLTSQDRLEKSTSTSPGSSAEPLMHATESLTGISQGRVLEQKRKEDESEENGDGADESFDLEHFLAVYGNQTREASEDVFEQAFEIIVAALRGQSPADLDVRNAASPVPKDAGCFLVAPDRVHDTTDLNEDDDLVSVKYQSFASGKVWWSPRARGCAGIVARAMNRGVRKSGVLGAKHGFSGRWFSLVTRDNVAIEVKGARCRSAVVAHAPSLVYTWVSSASAKTVPPLPKLLKAQVETEPHRLTPGRTVASANKMPVALLDSLASSPQEEDKIHDEGDKTQSPSSKLFTMREGCLCINGALRVLGRGILVGETKCATVHTQNQLHASKGVHGRLTTSSHKADYAEWFELCDPNELIEAGDVVQLRSPEQCVTKRTDGKGPILVVSSSPSIAAGVPSDLTRRQRGVLCGFLGQIPVKCIGPVECGDLMVPSGLHDGLAIPGRLSHADRLEPLGYAMETHDQSELCHVTCLVRWHGDPRWQSLRDRRLCELRHRWYAEVLPREVAGILTRGFLLFFAGFQPSFGATAALIALGMEIGALLVVLIVEQFIKPEYFESYPVVLLVKTVVNMYLLSQLFHTTDAEGAHVHQDDLGQLGKDIGFLLLDVAFRAL